MLVGDLMTAYPAFVRLGSDVRRAAELLCVSEVGQLMVLDHEGRFVGALAEEDLVRALLPGFDDVTGGRRQPVRRVRAVPGARPRARRPRRSTRWWSATRSRCARPTRSPGRRSSCSTAGIRRLPVVDDGAAGGDAVAGRPVPGGDLPFLTRRGDAARRDEPAHGSGQRARSARCRWSSGARPQRPPWCWPTAASPAATPGWRRTAEAGWPSRPRQRQRHHRQRGARWTRRSGWPPGRAPAGHRSLRDGVEPCATPAHRAGGPGDLTLLKPPPQPPPAVRAAAPGGGPARWSRRPRPTTPASATSSTGSCPWSTGSCRSSRRCSPCPDSHAGLGRHGRGAAGAVPPAHPAPGVRRDAGARRRPGRAARPATCCAPRRCSGVCAHAYQYMAVDAARRAARTHPAALDRGVAAAGQGGPGGLLHRPVLLQLAPARPGRARGAWTTWTCSCRPGTTPPSGSSTWSPPSSRWRCRPGARARCWTPRRPCVADDRARWRRRCW